MHFVKCYCLLLLILNSIYFKLFSVYGKPIIIDENGYIDDYNYQDDQDPNNMILIGYLRKLFYDLDTNSKYFKFFLF